MLKIQVRALLRVLEQQQPRSSFNTRIHSCALNSIGMRHSSSLRVVTPISTETNKNNFLQDLQGRSNSQQGPAGRVAVLVSIGGLATVSSVSETVDVAVDADADQSKPTAKKQATKKKAPKGSNKPSGKKGTKRKASQIGEHLTVAEMKKERIIGPTRKGYDANWTRFQNWLIAEGVTPFKRKIVRITQKQLEEYFVHVYETMKPSNGNTVPSVGSVVNVRSALKSKFRDSDLEFPVPKASDTMLFAGMKRVNMKAKKQSNDPITRGRDHMPFELYKKLAKVLMTRDNTGFGSLFAVMSWNLMDRPINTATSKAGHLSWVGDSIGMRFVTVKMSQVGEKKREVKHMYANPFIPEISVFLQLGLYLISNTVGVGDNVMPSNSSNSTFSTRLKTLIDDVEWNDSIDEVFKALLVGRNIGAYSLRKGASTYSQSGTTAACPMAATCLRADQSMGTPDDYQFPEKAGDQYCGRIVAGLPVNSAKFATLPAMFNNLPIHFKTNEKAWQEYVSGCFPGDALDENHGVAALVLASVVYHREFLETALPQNHLFFQSRAYSKLEEMGSWVSIEEPHAGGLQPSGIPPHVILFGQVRDLTTKVHDLTSAVTDLLALNRSQPLDANVVPQQPNNTQMQDIVEAALKAVLPSMLDSVGGRVAAPSTTPVVSDGGVDSDDGGGSGSMAAAANASRLPTNSPVQIGWDRWWFASKQSGFEHPIREWGDKAKKPDSLTKSENANFFHWSRLYGCMEAFLRDQSRIVDNPTHAQVSEMLTHCWPMLKKAHMAETQRHVTTNLITANTMSSYVPKVADVVSREKGKWPLWNIKTCRPRQDPLKVAARIAHENRTAAALEAKQDAKAARMEANALRRKESKKVAAQLRRDKAKQAKADVAAAAVAAAAAAAAAE